MEAATKACIINVGVGGWYAKGSERLERSLIYNGFAHDIMIWQEQLPRHAESHNNNPYNFKIWAFIEAIKRGNKKILWLDSSFWCIKTPYPIFDLIIEHGIFCFKTGYNCAQSCSDKALEWAGITRDEAELLPEYASGAVGFNIDNPDAKKVFELWTDGMLKGLFKNNRSHDLKDSADPRFLHARQDQSIFSLAIHMQQLKFDYQDYVAYYNSGYDKEKCLFFINGM